MRAPSKGRQPAFEAHLRLKERGWWGPVPGELFPPNLPFTLSLSKGEGSDAASSFDRLRVKDFASRHAPTSPFPGFEPGPMPEAIAMERRALRGRGLWHGFPPPRERG